MNKLKKRNITLDILKGVAIIAVILYHLGVSKYGYFGVDIFLVISGYLVTKGLLRNFNDSNFSYWRYLNKRISRLWPGLILISIVAFALGWMYMLPIHFKLNCEAAIGTCLFGNNFIQYITSDNYWMAENEYKPLMHTWYIGVLMQFYLIFPLIFIVSVKLFKQWAVAAFYILTGLSLLSLLLYVSTLMTTSQNFYLLPSRFFELGIGGLIAFYNFQLNNQSNISKAYPLVCILTFAIFLLFGIDIEPNKLRLIIVVALSTCLIWASNHFTINRNWSKYLMPLSFLGIASYSLYLSHQVLFALYRYIVNSVFTTTIYIYVLCFSFVFGLIIYFIFEKPLVDYLSKNRKNMYYVNGICLVLVLLITPIQFYYYNRLGFVRKIPELSIYTTDLATSPNEYNDAPRQLNKNFADNGKKNILVIGDSFGRDWVNILIEGGIDSVMNISYTMYVDENTKGRIAKADYVFVATNLPFFSSYNYNEIYPDLFNRKFWRVGLKSFGNAHIGNIYRKRNSEGYFDISVKENEYSYQINLQEKKLFKETFIDMMAPLMDESGSIKLFTDDKKLITADGIHLTKAGAKLYAEKLNIWQYLK